MDAGTYTTVAFGTELTYTVPDGWNNQEDLPGNFLVIPPTAAAEEVDAGTADYIGVYDGVAAASGDCEARRLTSSARPWRWRRGSWRTRVSTRPSPSR
ncbi:MAG: hypothetical protein K5924_02895 [Chloroflexi bacterium]|nr:hypothetical protein [Chloroflexota bacterium]